jgi:hypothetical protein
MGHRLHRPYRRHVYTDVVFASPWRLLFFPFLPPQTPPPPLSLPIVG